MFRWTTFTGGENGLSGVKRGPLLGLDLDDQRIFYYVVVAIVMAAAWLVWRVVHSPLGSVLVAIRENEQRARFAGYPVMRYKLAAFIISATVTGLGGVSVRLPQAVHLGRSRAPEFLRRDPGDDDLRRHGQLPRACAGRRVLSDVPAIVSGYTAAWQFWFGLLFMAFILFSPLGLVGLGERLLAPLRRKREGRRRWPRASRPRPARRPPRSCACTRALTALLVDAARV